MERHVAVKTPLEPNDKNKKRFADTARLSARVRHANVAAALDYLNEPDGEYYIEELIAGVNLQDCIDDNFPRLDADTTARVMHHLTKGVAASHLAGVVHRDLKPSNVMVDADLSFKKIKVTDFGIAKLAQSEIDRGTQKLNSTMQTQGLTSTMLGAIPFLAPEVLRKGKPDASPIGPPSDVWSLGAMGYWLLAGTYPFGTGFDAVAGILKGTRLPWDAQISADKMTVLLASKLQGIIERCLVLDVAKRPSASALASEIAGLGYMSGMRSTGVITSKGPYGGVWFGESDSGKSLMTHQAEVIAGGQLIVGAKISYFVGPGHPNPRSVGVIRLKDKSN